MEDELIIKNIKGKKEKGIELLVNFYGGFILTIIRQKLHNLNDYEDECMNDVLLAVWNNIDQFDSSKNTFKNWIASITKYKAIDYKRKYIKYLENKELDLNNAVDDFVIDEDILKKEVREELEELLSCLKPKDKELFIKHYLEDKKIAELSKEMNVKSEVLYNRLSRNRVKLRKLFSNKY